MEVRHIIELLEVIFYDELIFNNTALGISDDSTYLKVWYTVRNWWYMRGEPSLRKFCAEVHELAGNGPCVVDFVLYKWRMLNFTNPAHVNRWIDVVEYSIEMANNTSRASTTESWKVKKGGKRWYISEGLRYECIFTLKLINKENMEFRLNEHVCGISDISPFTTQNIEELLKEVSPFEGGPGMNSEEKAMGTPSDDE